MLRKEGCEIVKKVRSGCGEDPNPYINTYDGYKVYFRIILRAKNTIYVFYSNGIYTTMLNVNGSLQVKIF